MMAEATFRACSGENFDHNLRLSISIEASQTVWAVTAAQVRPSPGCFIKGEGHSAIPGTKRIAVISRRHCCS